MIKTNVEVIISTTIAWKLSKFGVFAGLLFFRIQTECGNMQSKSPFAVRLLENTGQKKLQIWTVSRIFCTYNHFYFGFNHQLL